MRVSYTEQLFVCKALGGLCSDVMTGFMASIGVSELIRVFAWSAYWIYPRALCTVRSG